MRQLQLMQKASGLVVPVNPAVINADSTYGLDVTPENAYGLGTSYVAPEMFQTVVDVKNSRPHILWLVLALAIAWWVMHHA